jgi:hypothetical protein
MDSNRLGKILSDVIEYVSHERALGFKRPFGEGDQNEDCKRAESQGKSVADFGVSLRITLSADFAISALGYRKS